MKCSCVVSLCLDPFHTFVLCRLGFLPVHTKVMNCGGEQDLLSSLHRSDHLSMDPYLLLCDLCRISQGPKSARDAFEGFRESIRHALSVPTNDDTTRWLMVSGRLNPDESHSNMFVNQMRSPKSLGESVTQ